ncbi:MAG: SLBB domain-containing protein, partial [Candidatus Tectomicrobia bacterium]
MEKVLTRHIGTPDLWKLETYRAHGGYRMLEKALKDYQRDDLVTLIRDAGLRGRGGAGFPTGVKWGFLPKDDRPRYLICNADESEPGTFKDRLLLEEDPHQILEGLIISCYAVRAHLAFIYLRGEFFLGAKRVQAAIDEAYAAGYLGKDILATGMHLDVLLHRGAGAYICGEETGLIESLEGKRAYPRIKPPFPANIGAFGMPTVVNNAETLCNIPHILEHGVEWYNSIGPERNRGTRMFCVSGKVQKPGVYELPLGLPLRDIIFEYGGGLHDGRTLKAVIPGG